MKDLVSIIIVNWNGKKYLKRCLPSISRQNYKKIEVIIVDNNSSDGSVEYIRKEFPAVKIINCTKNLGFAKANNLGYKACRGKYILFLNNDTKVTASFLTELLKVIKGNDMIGCVQSKILLMDNPDRLDLVGAFLTNSGFLYHYGTGKKDSKKYNKQMEIYSAKGACMLIRRDVLEKVKVGGEIYDSRYFAYFEETDLCHRIWLAGYKIVFVPSSVIYHKMGGTSVRLNSSFVQFHSYKNRINSYIKNLSLKTLVPLLLVHLIVCQIAAAFFLLHFKPQIFFAINASFFWNLTNLPKTLKMRRIIQRKIRKVSDWEIEKIIKKKVRLVYYYYLANDISKYKD